MFRLILLLALLAPAGAAQAATRNFLVGSFSHVRIDGPFAVTVTTGASAGAQATGSLNALDALTIRVDGDTAVVTMGAGNWSSDAGQMITPPQVALTTPMLSAATINAGATLTITAMKGQKVSLSVNGSGTLNVAAITADLLDARLVGTGQMMLAGKAQRALITVSGAGSVDAKELAVGDLTARSDGPGRLDLAARYTATITTTGLGPVIIAGSPSCTVRAFAGGPVRCGKQAN